MIGTTVGNLKCFDLRNTRYAVSRRTRLIHGPALLGKVSSRHLTEVSVITDWFHEYGYTWAPVSQMEEMEEGASMLRPKFAAASRNWQRCFDPIAKWTLFISREKKIFFSGGPLGDRHSFWIHCSQGFKISKETSARWNLLKKGDRPCFRGKKRNNDFGSQKKWTKAQRTQGKKVYESKMKQVSIMFQRKEKNSKYWKPGFS